MRTVYIYPYGWEKSSIATWLKSLETALTVPEQQGAGFIMRSSLRKGGTRGREDKMISLQWTWLGFSDLLLLRAEPAKYQHLQGQVISKAADLTAHRFLRVYVVRLSFCGNCPVSERSWSHSTVPLSVGVLVSFLPSLWLLSTSTELARRLIILRPLSLY